MLSNEKKIKRFVAIFIVTIFLAFPLLDATQSKQTSIHLDENDDFTHFFLNPIGEEDLIGREFNTSDGRKGVIRQIIDTKTPPTKVMDICDFVTIEWKEPKMKKPWKTYHIDGMSPAGGDGWYFHFDYKSSNKVDPSRLPKPEKGLPPWDDKRHHFVDDNNTQGPWDGTYDHPYNKIQDGINASKKGDTVFVFPGVYEENIVINKCCIGVVSLTYEHPVIDGGGRGSVITIDANTVTLHGFVIQNSGKYEEDAGLDIRSDSNTIFGNIVKNNQNAFYIHESSGYNIIFENTVQNNQWGIFIMHDCGNNYLFNNNFIGSKGFHAKDYSINQWDSEFYYGNYWDDYKGADENGDGIGDTPYMILGGNNKDNQPLINIWQNGVPTVPTVTGPNSGSPNIIYNYSIISLDSSNHDTIYEIHWGDGFSDFTSYLESNESQNVSHSWKDKGSYLIKVRAIDYYGAESDWATLQMSIPKNRVKIIWMIILRFLENYQAFNQLLKNL
ncbi:MAG: hypothetical protein H5T44_00150 [Thermoplasmatales archaeon]|nr:hypothetical protein [Thermoplasmatales archaeon]